MTAAEIRLMEFFAREIRLRNALASVQDKYDYVFIDCPPSLNMLTVNAMAAADSVLVPMQCEYYALEGLTALVDTISKLAAVVNPELKIEGCCAPCSITATGWPMMCPISLNSTSGTRSIAPSFPQRKTG